MKAKVVPKLEYQMDHSPEYPQTGDFDPRQDLSDRGFTPSYSNDTFYPNYSRPNQPYQYNQRQNVSYSRTHGPIKTYYQDRQTNKNYNPPRRNWDQQLNPYPQNRRSYPQKGRPKGPRLGRSQISKISIFKFR